MFGCALVLGALLHGGAPPSAQAAPVARISCGIARDIQSREPGSVVFIDIRMPDEFAHEHLAGAVNVPLARIPGSTLPRTGLLVVYCGEASCQRGADSAATLVSIGYSNVRVLEGGLAAWKQLRYPIEPRPAADRVGAVLPGALSKRLPDVKEGILDVRSESEFIAGHLPGALNVPLERLAEGAGSLESKQEWIVYDRLSERSRKAAVILIEGRLKASELVGGVAVWAKKGYPVEVGTGVGRP